MVGRPKGSSSKEMLEKKQKAISLMEINPTLSLQDVANHFEVSTATVSKWSKEVDSRKYPGDWRSTRNW